MNARILAAATNQGNEAVRSGAAHEEKSAKRCARILAAAKKNNHSGAAHEEKSAKRCKK